MTIDSFKQITVQGDAVTARMQHKSVIHRGNLYVAMGYNGVTRLGDMFFTNNARNWNYVTSLTDTKGNIIAGRESFGLVSHNEKVYLLGGYDGTNSYSHVYETTDMVRWKKLQDAPWSGRYGFVALSFDERLWVIGGIAAGVRLNDVWWTRDGVTWRQEANAPWTARVYHAGIVYNNHMFIVGGLGASARFNDVYYTSDGRRWVRMESNANFAAVDGHSLALFGNTETISRLILIGGQTGVGTYSDELWHSGEGNNWYLGDESIPMGDLRGHTCDYFDNRLIVVGGVHGAATYRNEVWESFGQMLKVK